MACRDLSARQSSTLPDGRTVNITFGEMRATDVRALLVFCADHGRSHNVGSRRLKSIDGPTISGCPTLSALRLQGLRQAGRHPEGGSEPTMMGAREKEATN